MQSAACLPLCLKFTVLNDEITHLPVGQIYHVELKSIILITAVAPFTNMV